MARIVYGMAGEGRGHAARARAITESLRLRHEVRLLASGDALALLAPLYRGTGVRVDPLPGLRFRYSRKRLDLVRSLTAAFPFMLALQARSRVLARDLDSWGADLAVVDFEPILPRAARRSGIPFVSIDHQHLLVTAELSGLPTRLRRWAKWLGFFVPLFCSGQALTLVASFHFPGLRAGWKGRVVPIGVPLRPEVKSLSPCAESHLVAYLRNEPPARFLDTLACARQEIRIYGLSKRPSQGPLRFLPVSSQPFLSDLASAHALLTTAGNQLLGEALHLGKPILAFPEPGNREQEINAWLLGSSGLGEQATMGEFSPALLAGFLERAAARARPEGIDGTGTAVRAMEDLLAFRGRTGRLAS